MGNENEWQNLSWAEKVQISQQGISHEDNLLFTYTALFLAIEAILIAAVFSDAGHYLACLIIFPFLGFILAYLWWRLTDTRGKAVDRWGAILYNLWNGVDYSTLEEWEKNVVLALVKHYEGCFKRNAGIEVVPDRSKYSWYKVIYSSRWWLIKCLPLLVSVIWVIVVIVTLINYFDC